jgi:N-acetylmuramoyl-L-alanine amidase
MQLSFFRIQWFFGASLFFLLMGCHSSIKQIESQSYNDRIRYLVIHYTTINYADSLDILSKKDSVSAHYLIPESNDPTYTEAIEPIQLVKEEKRAWHAGKSYWQGQKNLNDQSIGIELVYQAPCLQSLKKTPLLGIQKNLNQHLNSSNLCLYPHFDPKQIKVLITLIKKIQKNNPEITPERIIGHADIAPNRRTDPGPQFPWHFLYQQGMGAWYDTHTTEKYWKQFKRRKPSIRLAQKALQAYGYNVHETGKVDAQTMNALTAFQMHFTPWQTDGEMHTQTLAPLFALIEKYRSKWLPPLLLRYKKGK